MKRVILLLLAAMWISESSAQECTGMPVPHNHSESICFGFAMASAFPSTCNASTAHPNAWGIDGNYFAATSKVEAGNIVVFDNFNHFAIISSVESDGSIRVNQVRSGGASPEYGITVDSVGRGPVIAIYTRRSVWDCAFANQRTDQSSGGWIDVDEGSGFVQRTSGYVASSLYWNSQVSMNATYNGQRHLTYVQCFSEWAKSTGGGSSQQQYTSTVDNLNPAWRITFTAIFVPGYDCTFNNSFGGGGLTVSSNPRPSGYQEVVRQGNSVSVQTGSQSYNYLMYGFSHWSNDQDANIDYSASTSFQPYAHTSYTANYNVTRPMAPPNVTAGGTVGQNVQVAWTEHPCTDVTQYKVWRKVKHYGGEFGEMVLKATLNRGTTSWTDTEYLVTSGYSDDICNYAVQAYHSPTTTWSDYEWTGTFAEYNFQKGGGQDLPSPIGGRTIVIRDYGVGSFPNPFNPSTTISFSLPKQASVSLEIFDMMGRRVRALLVGTRSAGRHNVIWNGRDEAGADVSSGVYLYQFAAVPLNGDRPFSQSGKLVLTR